MQLIINEMLWNLHALFFIVVDDIIHFYQKEKVNNLIQIEKDKYNIFFFNMKETQKLK